MEPRPQGSRPPLSIAHPAGAGGGQSPRLPGAFAHRHTLPSPLLPWPGPGGEVSVLPGSLPQDRAIVRVSPPSGLGSGCSSVPTPCQCCFGQESPCKGDVTAMFKATTAAAALPPVQKKPKFFHILINPYEFLIESRVVSWEQGTLGQRVAWGPERLSSVAGTEKHLVPVSCCCGCDCVPGFRDTAMSRAERSRPSGAFSLGESRFIKHSYKPGKPNVFVNERRGW